jgi:hypothetical protein
VSNQLSLDDSSVAWLCLVLAKQGHQGFEVDHCISASEATVSRNRPAQIPAVTVFLVSGLAIR